MALGKAIVLTAALSAVASGCTKEPVEGYCTDQVQRARTEGCDEAEGVYKPRLSAAQATASTCKEDLKTATTAFARANETMDRILLTLGDGTVVRYSEEADTATRTMTFDAACTALQGAKERTDARTEAEAIETERREAQAAGKPFKTRNEALAAGEIDVAGVPKEGREFVDEGSENNYATTSTATVSQ